MKSLREIQQANAELALRAAREGISAEVTAINILASQIDLIQPNDPDTLLVALRKLREARELVSQAAQETVAVKVHP